MPPWQRTHYCGQLTPLDVGSDVALWGWVNARRDHGGVIFVDLRDREGLIQLVIRPEVSTGAHRRAGEVRAEYYVAAKGRVVRRSDDTINSALKTGEIEVVVNEFEILSPADSLPFPLVEGDSTAEEVRLRHRYLDLRRPQMQDNLRRRHKALKSVHKYFDSKGFIEIETPILFKSTPEGARDYLVPSRVNHGKFYALPQSPQLLKQILMIGGFDRYYQIARCFRDEDLRANRQPEFSQIDVEMTCPRPEDIQAVGEEMIAAIYKNVLNTDLRRPFQRISYCKAMERFGVDKPDLRFGLELTNITSALRGTEFRIFADILQNGGSIYAIYVPEVYELSRRELDDLIEYSKGQYKLGLAWVKLPTWEGPIGRHLFSVRRAIEAALEPAEERVKFTHGTLLMMGGEPDKIRPALGGIRLQLAAKFGLDKSDELKFLWVTDFPLFDYSADDKRMVSVNHPFTAPNPDDLAMLDSAPLKARALAYDMVLNGQELGGGSIRIHSRELQLKVFELLGLTREEAMDRFGFLLDALKYGAPPHGGIAFGVDRICMMLCGTDSLRDVIAFPKTQKAVDPMSGAPSEVDPRQLKELSIKVTP